jgi:Tfp pilus assembly protein PilO
VKSLAKQAAPINVAIQSKQELDNVLQDFRHLGLESNLSVSINVAIQSKQDLDNVFQDLSHLGFESNLSANFM